MKLAVPLTLINFGLLLDIAKKLKQIATVSDKNDSKNIPKNPVEAIPVLSINFSLKPEHSYSFTSFQVGSGLYSVMAPALCAVFGPRFFS